MKSISKISFCGDVCSECPRFIATVNNDAEALERFAELWYRLGFRVNIVSPEDLKCQGCSRNMYCSNGINDCEHLTNRNNCGECDYFPCNRINAVFQKTEDTEKICKEKCNDKEYEVLSRAFLRKKQILTRINRTHRSKIK